MTHDYKACFGELRSRLEVFRATFSGTYHSEAPPFFTWFNTCLHQYSEQYTELVTYCADVMNNELQFFEKTLPKYTDQPNPLRVGYLGGCKATRSLFNEVTLFGFDETSLIEFNARSYTAPHLNELAIFQPWAQAPPLHTLTLNVYANDAMALNVVPVVSGIFDELERLELVLGIGITNDPHPCAPEIAKAIAENDSLDVLETLILDDARLGDLGMEALARSPYLQPYTIRFGGWDQEAGNSITKRGAHALAQSEMLYYVTRLNFSWNDTFDDDALIALIQSPHLGELVHLNLGCTSVTEVGVRALAMWPGIAQLRQLNLICRAESDAICTILAQSTFMTGQCEVETGDDARYF